MIIIWQNIPTCLCQNTLQVSKDNELRNIKWSTDKSSFLDDYHLQQYFQDFVRASRIMMIVIEKCSIESMRRRRELQNSFFCHLGEVPCCVLATCNTTFNWINALRQERTRMNKIAETGDWESSWDKASLCPGATCNATFLLSMHHEEQSKMMKNE